MMTMYLLKERDRRGRVDTVWSERLRFLKSLNPAHGRVDY